MLEAKQLVRSLVEAFGDPDAIGALLTDDAEWWITPTVGVLASPSVGRDAIVASMRVIFTELWSEAAVDVHHVIAEGDIAAARFTLRAKAHFAELRPYENEYTVWAHRSGDRIDQVWEYLDTAWVSEQLSAVAVENLGSIFADPVAYADPAGWHATAKRIRDESPILKVSLPDFPVFWAITKHGDVMEIERNPDTFTNAPMPTLSPKANLGAMDQTPVKTLVQMDGEVHKANRNVVNDWFKAGNVKQMQARIDVLAKHYVDRMAAMGGRCDFVNDVALHYPLQVILSILGLPEEDYGRMLKLTQELFGAEDPEIARIGEDQSMFEVLLDFVDYFNALASDRRARPTDDLASVIANAEIGGAPLADMDMLGHFLIIATAGHDTTSSSISGGLLALMEHRDQLKLLQAEPDLIDNAADELIRYVSPVKHFMRTCRQPFTLRDVTFEPGDLLYLSYASANRDDEVFADPFRLDVRRPNAASHLAFGFGRHFCLGAHIARMEIRALFKELLPRLEYIELAGEPTWIKAHFVQGPKSIPISYQLR
jgi:cytochrome P450/ketosteroid isomerase-like protein